MNLYETQRLLDEYLLFHYGTDDEVLPWAQGPRDALGFARRTVVELLDSSRLPPKARALDLGCAVGRSAFELSALCQEVVAIDFSQTFIEAARSLAAGGTMAYRRLDEAGMSSDLVARVPPSLPRDRVRFEKGDAMDLPQDLGAFDVVHAANLLCRLPDPLKLLGRLPDLVRPGGQLLLTTPCTWLEEFTPRGHWPENSTRDWLKAQLCRQFNLDLEKDMPFLIREHARKYQWSVALATRWIRRG